MRRLAKAAVFFSLVALFISFLPRWAARHEENRRESIFKAQSSQFVATNLPDCPPTGPELDRFLESAQQKAKETRLWHPVCRVPELPSGKVTVVITRRSELESCANRWTPSNMHCSLDEPLRYLADPDQKHTWARREVLDKYNRETIWISSRPMAWQGWLFIEYQNRIQFFLVSLLGLLLIILVTFTLRQAIREQHNIHQEGEPKPPRLAELMLLSMATPRPAMVGDVNQEYSEMLELGYHRKAADQWYRLQVLRSVFPLVMHSFKRLIWNGF
jgi:hypothetical protein